MLQGTVSQAVTRHTAAAVAAASVGAEPVDSAAQPVHKFTFKLPLGKHAGRP